MSFQTKQIFGYLGAIPFITLSILPWISSNLAETSLSASSMYGAIILSFLGGMVWGWRKAKFFDLFIILSFEKYEKRKKPANTIKNLSESAVKGSL